MSVFEIHDVYDVRIIIAKVTGLVRVVDTIDLRKVILIQIDMNHFKLPFSVDYGDWIDCINSGQAVKVTDPFIKLTSVPPKLPKKAAERLIMIQSVAGIISKNPSCIHQRASLNAQINDISETLGLNKKTIQLWVSAWLQAGRNPVVIVRKFIERATGNIKNKSSSGNKRGAKSSGQTIDSNVPAYEVAATIEKAYRSYVLIGKMNWKDAYHEMLLTLYKVPQEAISEQNSGIYIDPSVSTKYRTPTWPQFRYRCRILKKASKEIEVEIPQGSRGRATDNVPGPGFYEIDATHFQIQLVSRLTKRLLVGRPTVYLIVETYDSLITGYAVSLESPSWAVAALALHNCFSDKSQVFKRLGLPFTQEDWPSEHLPTLLRADRAELVSNMGQKFPTSGIRVEVTPSMTPIAKGTVESKNSAIKHHKSSRYDLPGLFSKKRERRSKDGKRDAALDIFEFEKTLVEIIMDINGEPVNPKRIPPDALHEGAKIASRAGFHKWALTHRAGFTRNMGQNFVYEYLLTNGTASIGPIGIKFQGEVFTCDRLRELGILNASRTQPIKIQVSYNPLLASELYFFDTIESVWFPAYNIDPEIYNIRASFAEARDLRAFQNQLASQAEFNNYSKRRVTVKNLRKSVRDSVRESKETLRAKSATDIRKNRAEERANERIEGLNGSIPPTTERETPITQASDNNINVAQGNDALSLWSEVDATNRIK
ncbi:Transposon Tn7-like transposase protein B [Pseudomonas syringae pv. berberidis]|nr:Transposon Tn7-like transposase protein B [Pseudomonas syringae pv. berberidis]RMM35303.1 Transposon Tn7-like transposase protein B [Pseudomonas syringae pv. berberidis]RMQ36271.1 Transposon Tn7-like transposase protein B [Pseudomonas syringae pv. berberidis]